MSVNQPTPQLHPAEKVRSRTLHLVTLPAQTDYPLAKAAPVASPAKTISKLNVAHTSLRKREHIRESERISTLALAGAAVIAPVIWIAHALLIWLDVL